MKPLLLLCTTALLISASHDYSRLMRANTEGEFRLRSQLMHDLSKSFVPPPSPGEPKVETPTMRDFAPEGRKL